MWRYLRGFLPCLRRDLSFNQLSGTLPEALGSLNNLVTLCASFAQPWSTLQHRADWPRCLDEP